MSVTEDRETTPVDPDHPLPILAVDDRTENLAALEAVLEPLGLEVVTATSGREALRLLLERDFSLILLDVRMPGMDGLETAQLIKHRERSSDIPIVFLTAARNELDDMLRGYDLGAVDYVLKPFDVELLRSKVAVFAQLGHSRRLLRRSEAFLRAAFDAAPVGKTVLDAERRIVRANPAFARVVGSAEPELAGRSIVELCEPGHRDALAAQLDKSAGGQQGGAQLAGELRLDVQLLGPGGQKVWVAPAASPIELGELGRELVLVQWVDVTLRRSAEQARAELLVEQAARAQAEAQADRLEKLNRLVEPIADGPLDDLLGEFARRLADLFDADAAEVELNSDAATAASPSGMHVQRSDGAGDVDQRRWEEVQFISDAASAGNIRLLPPEGRPLTPSQRELLRDAAERVSLTVRRAQLHEQERRIALELQRGLLPTRLPELRGVMIAADFEVGEPGAKVGGDWYDCFLLPDERLAVVIGDVTGSGIRAASAMGQLRSVTRAFAIGDQEPPSPAEVLNRLQRYHGTAGLEELFTLLYLIVDSSGATLTWANAGHPPPLLRENAGTVRALMGAESMICGLETTYKDRQESLAPGDTVVVFTDGLIERRGETIDDGIERLTAAIRSGPQRADELCAHLIAAARSSTSPTCDDVTALVLRMTPDRPELQGNGAGDRRVQVTLAPDPGVPSSARRMLERSFGELLDRDELERAKLAISELATNAVRHGLGEITVVAELQPERLLVEVIDHGSGFEHVARRSDFDEIGGWGLTIVDAATSRWGLHEGTTHVWFEIERRGPRVGAGQRST